VSEGTWTVYKKNGNYVSAKLGGVSRIRNGGLPTEEKKKGTLVAVGNGGKYLWF